MLLVAALLVPAMVFAGGAKAKTPTKSGDIKIAIVSQNQGNPVFYDLEAGARDTAKKLGIQFEWYAPETGDSVKEAELIEAAANAGAHGIGVVPLDVTLQTTMQAVSKRGVYVSTVNSDTISYPEMAFANGTAMFDIGYECGKLALKYLTDKNKTYTIAMIEGQPGTEAFTLRMDGFEKCLKDNGIKFTVLAKLPCDDDFNKAGEQVETFTIANPNLDMWFFSGGWPFFLEVKALSEFAKWHAKPNHWCITVDAFPPEKTFFEAGLCEGAVSQNYYRMGEMTVQYLYDLVTGKGLPKADKMINNTTPWFATGSFPVTPENWQAEFGKMKPW
jgi:ribose transport system substrate-binding protein